MTVIMTTLVVQRPRGQRPDTYRDPRLDEYAAAKAAGMWRDSDGPARVYSYTELPNHSLKIYEHKIKVVDGKPKMKKTKGDPIEIAHYRANQWDCVVPGDVR